MNKLKEIFASILGVSIDLITDTTSPENTASWDSLNAIVLVTEIEKAFKITFKYDEAMAVRNFADAVKLVHAKGGVL
jgi:acyl carrier protein